MNRERRTAQQIRGSLSETKRRLDSDMEELETRLHETLSPKEILTRHPALVGIAGALVGLLILRNPGIVTRSLARVAQVSAPFVVKAILSRQSPATSHQSSVVSGQRSW